MISQTQSMKDSLESERGNLMGRINQYAELLSTMESNEKSLSGKVGKLERSVDLFIKTARVVIITNKMTLATGNNFEIKPM